MSYELDRSAGAGLGMLAALVVALAAVPMRSFTANTSVAMAMVLPVVLGAVIGGRTGGLATAVVAVLSFDFFHTRPYNSLTISSADDVETMAVLALVAVVVGSVAGAAHRQHVRADEGRDVLRRVHEVAEMAALGRPAGDVLERTRTDLVELLGLRSCTFEAGERTSALPVIARSGQLEGAGLRHRFGAGGLVLPAGGVELAVLGGGWSWGRFVLVGDDGAAGVSVDARRAAVALADQVGAALAAFAPPPVRRSA